MGALRPNFTSGLQGTVAGQEFEKISNKNLETNGKQFS